MAKQESAIAPVAAAPLAPAPVTSASVTSAPVTSAPVTSAPVTSECCAPLNAEPVPATLAGDLAAAFKALGDPVRLQLLSMIASNPDGEVCVCDLTPAFTLSGPTISHHLKVLREAGLIDHERRGTWVYYRPVRARLATLAHLLDVSHPAV